MIIFYCYDVAERQTIHNYFRDRGLTLEAVPPAEVGIRSYAADAEAVLIVGNTPPGLILSLNPELPMFTVGRYQLGNSFHFRDYEDPKLYEMLSAYSSDEAFFSYNEVLFGKLGKVLFLGYDLSLTPTERSILSLLVAEAERSVPAEEIIEKCIGDVHGKKSAVSAHISRINKKAMNIGGRRLISSPSSGYYKIKKYI